MSLTPRSPDEFKPPEIDLGLDLDEKLGEVIAQAKVKAMEEGSILSTVAVLIYSI